MEPVRTRRCFVLAIVFVAAAAIVHGCGKRSDVDRGDVEKSPSQVVAAESAGAKVVETPDEGPKTEPPVEADKTDKTTEQKTDNEPQKDEAMPQAEGEDADEYGDLDKPETPAETARRLGPPLVEKPEKLKRLDPVNLIWLDKAGGRLVMVGEVCQRQAPLEMLVCLWHTKEHEAVLTVRAKAMAAHAGLLALGAKAGSPVQFMPKYVPAGGQVIDVEVIWNDENGKIQKARGQEWVRNFQTKESMQHDWVFAGSGFWTDEETGLKHYQAEGGDFICVSNFSTAMLDLPIESSQQNDALMFEAFTERIPPLGTPVTIVLKPRPEKEQAK